MLGAPSSPSFPMGVTSPILIIADLLIVRVGVWRGSRSLNCGITAFEMLGRFGLGGQVWLGMDNSNQTKE